jgi:hypothetical protein
VENRKFKVWKIFDIFVTSVDDLEEGFAFEEFIKNHIFTVLPKSGWVTMFSAMTRAIVELQLPEPTIPTG